MQKKIILIEKTGSLVTKKNEQSANFENTNLQISSLVNASNGKCILAFISYIIPLQAKRIGRKQI